ncbi:TPA: restriction endonuclease subunit S [Proteus mirabilis]
MSVEVTEPGLNLIPAGYKQTEVGVIPEDWKCYSFGDLVDYKKGYAFKSDEYGKTGIRIIRVSDTSYSGIKDDSPIFISDKLAKLYHAWSIKEGDLIFSTVGSKPPMYDSLVGKAIYVTKKYEGSLLNQNAVRIRAKSKTEGIQSLLLNHFRTERYIDFIELIFRGNANQASITLENLFEFKIPLPRLEKEQTAIANALSDVDLLISELEKLIAKKQSIKTGTMQQLLTGRTRLPQFALREDGTKKGTKKSELGEIPEDWKILAMGDLGSTYGGLSGKSKQDFGHGNSLYVPFTNVMANVVVDVDNLEKVDVRETQNNLALGDLLFNGSSETPEEVCFSALVSADIRKLYLNSFCFGFRSNQKNAYLPLYLAYWFRSEVGRAAVLVMAQGSTRYNISKSQFMKLPIVLPDTEEQTAIATILSDMDAEIQALNQRLSKTRQIKQGMMQELLTGKTRLVQPVNKESQHD